MVDFEDKLSAFSGPRSQKFRQQPRLRFKGLSQSFQNS